MVTFCEGSASQDLFEATIGPPKSPVFPLYSPVVNIYYQWHRMMGQSLGGTIAPPKSPIFPLYWPVGFKITTVFRFCNLL